MVELPPEMTKNFGVTARKFSSKTSTSVDKDRSVWTDTPADRARKEQVWCLYLNSLSICFKHFWFQVGHTTC